jgi:hypothetical protein
VRSFPRRLGVLVVVPALVFGVVACGDDDGAGPSNRDEVVAMFAAQLADENDFGLGDEESRCIAEAVVDTIGFENIRGAMADAGGDLGNIQDEEFELELLFAMFDAMTECTDMESLFETAQ